MVLVHAGGVKDFHDVLAQMYSMDWNMGNALNLAFSCGVHYCPSARLL